jgi:tripartite-type tricarboxylate transporter receptor subunit TctC
MIQKIRMQGLKHASKLLIGGGLILFSSLVFSQTSSNANSSNYPNKSIRLVSPIPPGGAPDLVARALANRLSNQLGLSVFVENKVGSNGNIAADVVSHSPADGYTLLIGMDSLFVINPYLYSKSVNANNEFRQVATLASNQFVLAVNSKLPVKNLAEFVDYAKKANPIAAYASGGNGSQHHLTMEMLKARADIDLLHVPYKGGVEATTATIGGESIAMFSGTSNANLIRSGKLKAIAVSGLKRSKDLPEVPTIAESYPGFDNTIWIGLFAPKDTPDAVVAKLRQEVNKALTDPEMIETLAKAGGIEPLITTQEEFTNLIKKDQLKYSTIIKKLNLKLN